MVKISKFDQNVKLGHDYDHPTEFETIWSKIHEFIQSCSPATPTGSMTPVIKASSQRATLKNGICPIEASKVSFGWVKLAQ